MALFMQQYRELTGHKDVQIFLCRYEHFDVFQFFKEEQLMDQFKRLIIFKPDLKSVSWIKRIQLAKNQNQQLSLVFRFQST
jgi:hypothetical protein